MPSRHPALGDVALWSALAVPVLLGSPAGLITVLSPWWLPGGLAVLAVAAGIARRHPLGAVTLATGLSLLNVWFFPAMFVMSYLAGRRGERERAPLVLFAIIVVAGAQAGTVLASQTAGYPGVAYPSVAPLLIGSVMPWLVGRYRRQRRELTLARRQRDAQLARERRIIAEQARLRERSRIARQMHDQLGHDLSMVALRAAALEVDPRLDGSAQAAVGELRLSMTGAVERLHDIIGMLGPGDEVHDSLPPVRETVEEIIEGVRSCGAQVQLRREGGDHERPAPIEHIVRGVVREALTNAVKYAAGAAITVTVTGAAQQTAVRVVNAAPPGGFLPDLRGSGLGLAGLRERVQAIGGVFRAGDLDGGFDVAARLPHTVSASTADPFPVQAAEEPRHFTQTKRRLIPAIGVPVALAATLVAVMMAYAAEATEASVLRPERFEKLRIGQPHAQVRMLLPAMQVRTGPVTGAPAPPAAECQSYRSRNGDLLETEFTVYRLCFAGGRLVTKEVATATGG